MGNLGAPPKPPRTGSKSEASSRKASSRVAAVSRSARRGPPGTAVRSSAAATSSAERRMSVRFVRQASWMRGRISRSPGRPQRRGLRKVGPGEERLLVGRHHDRQRPAARAGQLLANGHEMLVEIGPFLAVDLDRDEVRVEEPGHRLVGEGLPFHHVAPVAGRIADGQEDRPVFAPGAVEGLLAPRIPVHGVVGVLPEVGARLPGQAVRGRHFLRRPTSSPARGRSFPGSWRGCWRST